MKYCIQLVHILKIIGTPSKRSTQMRSNSYTEVWEIPFAMSINKPLERFTPTFSKLLDSWKNSSYNQVIQPVHLCPCPTVASFAKFFAHSELSYGCLITICNYFIIFENCIMCFHQWEVDCKCAFMDSQKNCGNILISRDTNIFSPYINVFFHQALQNFSSLSLCAHCLQNSFLCILVLHDCI
jgi:hypothetical protein